ncbi:hypothetical protein CC80DRAFT_543467 [Byssothecium circinans]|uniref:Uncharacterized protein n=1 Tax=Byssothecium circinans TaxID=147558 RepID=A0A6A5U889_9PLEO|nr:hypothetical protein CC80DRAFT_543467 [Byssothecium circinans]
MPLKPFTFNSFTARLRAFEIHSDLKTMLDAAIAAENAQQAWSTIREKLERANVNAETAELTNKPFVDIDETEEEEFGDFESADPLPKPRDPFKQPILFTPKGDEINALLPPSPPPDLESELTGTGLSTSKSTLLDTSTRHVRRWGKFALRHLRSADIEAESKARHALTDFEGQLTDKEQGKLKALMEVRRRIKEKEAEKKPKVCAGVVIRVVMGGV